MEVWTRPWNSGNGTTISSVTKTNAFFGLGPNPTERLSQSTPPMTLRLSTTSPRAYLSNGTIRHDFGEAGKCTPTSAIKNLIGALGRLQPDGKDRRSWIRDLPKRTSPRTSAVARYTSTVFSTPPFVATGYRQIDFGSCARVPQSPPAKAMAKSSPSVMRTPNHPIPTSCLAA